MADDIIRARPAAAIPTPTPPAPTHRPVSQDVTQEKSSVEQPVDQQHPSASKSNFTLESPYSSEDGKKDPSLPTLTYPSGTTVKTMEALSDTPNLQSNKNVDAPTKEYLDVIRNGMVMMPPADGLVAAANRSDANYLQRVQSGNGPLFGFIPKFKKQEGTKYTGEAARNLIRSTVKIGTVFAAPMWHSGFWIVLRAATESDLLDLFDRINRDKITIGRSTYGLLFSNVSAYTHRTIMDFVVEHLYETSLDLKDNEDIRDYLKLPSTL